MNRRHSLRAAAIATAAIVSAAAVSLGLDRDSNWIRPTNSLAAAPERLADTGLYSDFATGTVAADVLSFAPQYPLWSDGARKRRWLWLPPGTSIDASDPDRFEFPIGTKAWKEFSFERRIETRYLERAADGSWIRATYLWSEDGEDARLAPERGMPGACESSAGAPYDIPSRLDCAACHEAGRGEVLGFSALQLSPDRDPLAPHAEPLPKGAVDLPQLVERGLVRGLPAGILESPPRIAASTPRERAALGYLHANCGTCHNSRGPLASLGLSLDVSVAPGEDGASAAPAALKTAIGKEARFRSLGLDAHLRIAPGDAERSLISRRMATRSPLLQMPPLGTRAPDGAGLALLTAWIEEDLFAPRDSAADSLSPRSLVHEWSSRQ